MKLRIPMLACSAVLMVNAYVLANDPAPNAPPNPARPLIEQAISKMKSGDVDDAISLLDQAIQVSPRNAGAHVLRGSIEASKWHWNAAEAELSKAVSLAPNDTKAKVLLANVKFSANDYAGARTIYVLLEATPDLDDLAKFDVYLCDLYGHHDDLANKELAGFKEKVSPTYYFAHGAERLYHHDVAGGKAVMDEAVLLFPIEQNGQYAQQLRDAGYLPLPSTH